LRGSSVVETALFRITQEAITNIVRHAEAKHATVQLSQSPTHWILIVQDDGHGFDSATTLNQSLADQRWGLFGVRERVELLGGAFQIESTIGKGTTLKVEIPIEKI
jgi:signal transduction histidine kinase